MPISAITFDLDDTLWPSEEVLSNATKWMHQHLDDFFPMISKRFDQNEFINIMESLQLEFPNLAHDYTFLRKKALEICAEEVGYNKEEVASSAFNVFITARSQPILYPGVVETLQALKDRGIRLGTLTNGNCDISKITCLHEVFQFAISAADVGKAKPHPAQFERAIQEFGVPPEDIVHIGDDYNCDIIGAKNKGFRTIWISTTEAVEKHKYGSHETSYADAVVQSVPEILQIIDRWSHKQ